MFNAQDNCSPANGNVFDFFIAYFIFSRSKSFYLSLVGLEEISE